MLAAFCFSHNSTLRWFISRCRSRSSCSRGLVYLLDLYIRLLMQEIAFFFSLPTSTTSSSSSTGAGLPCICAWQMRYSSSRKKVIRSSVALTCPSICNPGTRREALASIQWSHFPVLSHFFFFLVLHRFLPVCTDLGSLNVYPLYFWLADWDKEPTFPDKTLCYRPWCFPVLFTSQAENPSVCFFVLYSIKLWIVGGKKHTHLMCHQICLLPPGKTPPNSLTQLLSSSQTSSSSCSLWSSRIWGSPLHPSQQTADLGGGGGSQVFLCDWPHPQQLPHLQTPLKHTWRSTWPTWPTTGLQLLSSVSVIVWVRHTEVKLNLYNVEIERVYETKFLGVIIDNKVCWKAKNKTCKTEMIQVYFYSLQNQRPTE